MKVELLDHTGNDNTVANVARVSFAGEQWNDLPSGYTEEQRDRLIRFLAREQHTSPFRHVSVSLRVTAPIFIARQLAKHQVGMSWNEVSRRYVNDVPDFHFPEQWRNRPEKGIKQGSDGVHEDSYQWSVDYASFVMDALALYESMIDDGVAPEMARMVLPQSMMTQWVWSGSIMAFAHVYKLRSDSHAQKEARDIARMIDDIIRPLYPVSWSALVD